MQPAYLEQTGRTDARVLWFMYVCVHATWPPPPKQRTAYARRVGRSLSGHHRAHLVFPPHTYTRKESVRVHCVLYKWTLTQSNRDTHVCGAMTVKAAPYLPASNKTAAASWNFPRNTFLL